MKRVIDDLVELTLIGRFYYLNTLLIFNNSGDGHPVALNPDVEYYLRRIFRIDPPIGKGFTSVDHLLPKLTEERLTFLEEALKRKDFQSVIDTTLPCAPRGNLFLPTIQL